MQNNIAPVNTHDGSISGSQLGPHTIPSTGPIERPSYFSQSASAIAQQIVTKAPYMASYWRQLAQYMLNREASTNQAVFAQVCLSNQTNEQINAAGAAVLALQLHPQAPENWDNLASIVKTDEFIPVSLQGQYHVYSGESLRQMAALLRQQNRSAQG